MHPYAKDTTRECWRLELWPSSHQQYWATITRRAGILDDTGSASHWRAPTADSHRKAWGRFLRWAVAQSYPQETIDSPFRLLAPEIVKNFIETLRGQQLKWITVAGYVSKLETLAINFYPDSDWGWLKKIRRRLRARANPRKTVTERIVLTDRALQCAIQYMRQALTSPPHLPLDHHSRFRDGLMMAILISRCLRLRNIANMDIGIQLVSEGDCYALRFSADEMKNHKSCHIPLPGILTSYIEDYLENHRPALLGKGNTQALWISNRGLAMTEASIQARVRTLSKRLFGKELNPHAFRHSGATSVAINDPEGIYTVPVLLQHKSSLVGEMHYNQARTMIASRRHIEVIKSVRKALTRG